MINKRRKWENQVRNQNWGLYTFSSFTSHHPTDCAVNTSLYLVRTAGIPSPYMTLIRASELCVILSTIATNKSECLPKYQLSNSGLWLCFYSPCQHYLLYSHLSSNRFFFSASPTVSLQIMKKEILEFLVQSRRTCTLIRSISHTPMIHCSCSRTSAAFMNRNLIHEI